MFDRPHRSSVSALVVGGGPGGSVLATLLARAGWQVTLLEQHRFPRDKVCGECLSGVGVDVLCRLGVDGLVRSYGAIPLHFTHLHAPDGQSTTLPLPRPMWGVSRHVLDQLLLIEAGRSGVDVRQPSRCESIEPPSADTPESDGPTARWRDLLTNEVRRESFDWIVVADGKGGLLGKTPRPTQDFGLKVHFSGVDGPGDAIELFGFSESYGGVAPIEANRWNLAFSVPASLLRLHAGDLDMVFQRLVGENPTLARRLRNAERVSPYLASPLPRFGVRQNWPTGVVPIGNAAAALEPIGGEGMGLALRSAELAAEHLVRAGKSRKAFSPEGLQAAYGHLWRTRRAACRAAARVVSSGVFAGPAMQLLRHHANAGRMAMKLMGK